MNTLELAAKFKQYYAPIWAPPDDFSIAGGKGPYLFDAGGKAYIDFVTGIAVNALGYAHPALVKAYKSFAKIPLHASSLYLQEDRIRLAELLVQNSFAQKVFFCNSGTEANEGAIKFARKWASTNFGGQKHKIIVFQNGFHGRTYGSLSATAQEKFHKGFEPLVPGFIFLEPNNAELFERAAQEKEVCAVLVEPVQAEGGIVPCKGEWLGQVREICTARNMLLVFDEIQVGMGRLGTLWAYEHFGVEPDMISIAKALGGGIPFGAVLLKDTVASCLHVGDHGNTTGGSPLAARLGIAVLHELLKPGFFEKVNKTAVKMHAGLKALAKKYPNAVKEARGFGMLQGLALKTDVPAVMRECRKNGLLVCKAGGDVLRLLPPLNVKGSVVKKALSVIDGVLSSLQ